MNFMKIRNFQFTKKIYSEKTEINKKVHIKVLIVKVD